MAEVREDSTLVAQVQHIISRSITDRVLGATLEVRGQTRVQVDPLDNRGLL